MSVAEAAPSSAAVPPDLPVGVPFPAPPARPGWFAPAKRALDVTLAVALLVAASPVILAAAIGIVASGRPDSLPRRI